MGSFGEKKKVESGKGMAELGHWVIRQLRDTAVGWMGTLAAEEIVVGFG